MICKIYAQKCHIGRMVDVVIYTDNRLISSQKAINWVHNYLNNLCVTWSDEEDQIGWHEISDKINCADYPQGVVGLMCPGYW